MSKKVLLTSVCRPMGPRQGDAPSVGYELLYSQVTRAQGLFSPRTVNVHFSLEYIAENLDAPTVVLQYPSKSELIRELKKGYDYVGVSFLLALMHKMKETVALIRHYAPNTKIVLGGYGTVLKDEQLKPYGDYICREEGVGFFRRLLGESEMPMPYKHPLMVSWLKSLWLEGIWHGQDPCRTGLSQRLRFLLHLALLLAQTHPPAARGQGHLRGCRALPRHGLRSWFSSSSTRTFCSIRSGRWSSATAS